MTHYYDTKLAKIINQEADGRLDGAIISEILRIGWERCAAITDEEIDSVESNGIMTKELCQSMMRAERRICQECDMFKDFFSYIRKYMGINGCQVHDITLDKSNFGDWEWENMLDELGLDPEELDEDSYGSIDIIAIVD